MKIESWDNPRTNDKRFFKIKADLNCLLKVYYP